MKRRNPASFAATAILGALAISTPSLIQAQEAGLGQPRSKDERVVTQTPTPPPVNSDALKAAEGRLGPVAPGVPVPGGAVDPRTGAPVGRAADGQGDPATKPLPGVRGAMPGTALAVHHPAGMDVAMLVEHALGMAIEGSALKAIAEQDAASEPSRMLMDHATHQLAESKAMLTKAATDGREVPATSPTRRFYASANNYMTTLASLGTLAPADKAQVALINHSVKEALEADHIQQMGRMATGGPATEQLLKHAAAMKAEGSMTLGKLAGSGTIDLSLPPSPMLLAQRGRELLDAAEQLNTYLASPAAMAPGGVPAIGPNPARFQDTRPEIIGGTFATGSAAAGTSTPAQAAQTSRAVEDANRGADVKPNPADKPGPGTTGGLQPR